MHRQEDDPGVDALGLEAPQGIKAAQDRHGQVGYDAVGPEGLAASISWRPSVKVPRRGLERRFGLSFRRDARIAEGAMKMAAVDRPVTRGVTSVAILCWTLACGSSSPTAPSNAGSPNTTLTREQGNAHRS
jgi:hypothetical protein